jgi:molybdate transport system permease protein
MRASVRPERTVAPRLPWWLVAVAAVGIAFVVAPVVVMATRGDWASFWSLVTSASSLDALRLSLFTSVVSTAVCVVVGVPVAMVLARTRFPGLSVVRALVLLPLVLPPVVCGLALLYAFGRRGPIGHALDDAGISIAFTTTAVVISHVFVALPFLVLTLEGALKVRGTGPELAAASLGAGPGRTFWLVTLPSVAPALAGGALLAFARSLGEFGATLTFAGSLQGVTRTLPLEIYLQRETDPDAAVALSMLLVIVAVVVVALVHTAGGTRNFRRGLAGSVAP